MPPSAIKPLLAAVLLILLAAAPCARAEEAPTDAPPRPHKVCIAHRGASGNYPEHTMLAYRKAIEMGADFVEPDLALTKDGVFVCVHDDTLERTTNVAEVFPDRARTANPNGRGKKTWRIADFTAAEIKKLDAGKWKDPSFMGEQIVTFQEAIDYVRAAGGGKVGIYPELKSPAYHSRLGFKMVEMFLKVMKENGLDTKEGQAKLPVVVQCFEPEPLKEIRKLAGDAYTLVQLVDASQAGLLMGDVTMRDTAKYADGLGPAIPLLLADKSRIKLAHELGLVLHPYTADAKQVPKVHKDAKAYMEYLLYDLEIDGLFTNNPDMFPR